DIAVAYETVAGTAAGDFVDFAPASGTVIIPAGATTATITVVPTFDIVHEINEQFSVNLISAIGKPSGQPDIDLTSAIIDNQGIGTILGNDPAPKLSIDNVTVNESDGTATFTVSTDGRLTELPFSVDYAINPGSANGPGDPQPDYN